MLAVRSERGQLMLKTAVMMSSDRRYALLRGMLVLSLKQWLLNVEHVVIVNIIPELSVLLHA